MNTVLGAMMKEYKLDTEIIFVSEKNRLIPLQTLEISTNLKVHVCLTCRQVAIKK